MTLTKKDLVKIKDVVLEVMEPMIVASQNEFSKIDDKFSQIDEKFTKINNRFNKIDKRFDNVDKEIKEKFDKVLDGQDKIMKSIGDLKSDNIADSEVHKRQEEKNENFEIRI
ncbi:hypothetical protein KKB43_03015 [Patescibacteria group bacterium]|nr:hypothetical protein [Patescibacteria group bacterium]MBU4579964.1 hypothetical protein [Patescibacteria group bacterium]